MSVLTLDDVKSFLGLEADSVDDAKLLEIIDAAEASIVAKCGPLAPTVTVDRVRGGSPYLSLPSTPVVSLTTVTPVGSTALDVSKLYVSDAGIVEFVDGGTFSSRFYDVTYQAGRASCPPDLLRGTLEHVRHMYSSLTGGALRVGQKNAAGATPAGAYLFTWKVESLIAPYVQMGIG